MKCIVQIQTMMHFCEEENRSPSSQIRFKTFDGRLLTCEVWASMIDYYGEKAMLGFVHDITEIKKAEQQQKEPNKLLLNLSQLDGLTNIPNRRYFNDILDREWKAAITVQSNLSLIMIDIDYFKLYNGHYGHN